MLSTDGKYRIISHFKAVSDESDDLLNDTPTSSPSPQTEMSMSWEPSALADMAMSWVCHFSVVLIWFFTSHQQFFSYIGTGLSGLNQYLAGINVSSSRTTTQWRRPFDLEHFSVVTPWYNKYRYFQREGYTCIILHHLAGTTIHVAKLVNYYKKGKTNK